MNDNNKSEPVKRHKRGDVREDGKLFWCYGRRKPGEPFWVTEEQYAGLLASYERVKDKRKSSDEHRAKLRQRYQEVKDTPKFKAKCARDNEKLRERTAARKSNGELTPLAADSEFVRKYKMGDVNPTTGLIFLAYRENKAERWLTPEAFSARNQRISAKLRRLPHPAGDAPRLKRGFVSPDTGMVFWKYNKRSPSGAEWVTQDRFDVLKARAQQSAAARLARDISPRKGLIVGQVDAATGRVFCGYSKSCVNGERWSSPEGYATMLRKRSAWVSGRAIPPIEERKWTRGDVNPDTGLLFWGYCKGAKNCESWLDPDAFAHRAKKSVDRCNHWQRRKLETDPVFAAAYRARVAIRMSYKRSQWKKASLTRDLLGCSFEVFSERLSQMRAMYPHDTKLHLDHIVPISLARTEQEVALLCHYENFQLLPGRDNIRKSDMVPPRDKWPSYLVSWLERRVEVLGGALVRRKQPR